MTRFLANNFEIMGGYIMPRFIELPSIILEGFNSEADLPYDLTVESIKRTIENTHNFLNKINNSLVSNGYGRLEETMLGNTFAGFLSEVIVKNLGEQSKILIRNKKIGGYPDLIPKEKYPEGSVLRGEGVEVKASKQKGGWQGHNPEAGWLIVFRYVTDTETEPIEDRNPTEIVEVLGARLSREDWSFSGRKRGSRRTITASIVKRGMEKLRSNVVYLKPSTYPLKKWLGAS